MKLSSAYYKNVTYDVQVSLGELQSSEHVTSISKAKTREKKNLTFNFNKSFQEEANTPEA